ncbi:MAG: glycoside hydrolase family 97 protein, partial [Bacteroidota bacterium]|nr:glycoside hydrolase family 97 protein [Bacteroidota bacterium]
YSITYNQKALILTSALGLDGWQKGLVLSDIIVSKQDTTWKPVYGERNLVRNHYRQMIITLLSSSDKSKLKIQVRAYDAGIAFRYVFPEPTQSGKDITIKKELTEFTIPNGGKAWFTGTAQGIYSLLPLSTWPGEAERPLVLQLADGRYACLAEAALVDYCRTKFSLDPQKANTIRCAMDGEVEMPAPFSTPWRVVMAAEHPGELLANNDLLLNLNLPCEIHNTSWIKPGKVIREVTLTTIGAKACIDFASTHNLQYIEFDAGWYGPENDSASSALAVNVDPARSPGPLALKEVIAYGKSKGIGVILYVDQKALSRQLDSILPLYQSWGVKGVKFGFVNVGSQQNTSWLHEAVRKAAKYHLIIDIHDEYRPSGYSRTYPNLLTQEGIRGDEESPDNHLVLITMFTRMIAGAGDQTNCYFGPQVEKMGSHASQMAKAICIYSPLQFIYWYDRPEGSPIKKGGAGSTASVIKEIPDLSFYDALPTVWDDTKVIEGKIGEYGTIARRHGDNWYVGSLTSEARSLILPLGFLNKSLRYEATIYADDASLPTHTKLAIRKMKVDASTVLKFQLMNMNGLAIIIRPLKK